MSPRKPLAKSRSASPEILGVDHIYLSVAEFERSHVYYDRLMKSLGFKKGTFAVSGEPHCHYYNRSFQITIRPARNGESKHDSHSPGLHHLCLRVENKAAVDMPSDGSTSRTSPPIPAELNFRQARVADQRAGSRGSAFRFPAVHGA